MSVTWIKTSVALGLTLAATIFHTSSVQAGPFGRAVLGNIINNSPRAQMVVGTVAPIVQTAQAQGGRLSPGQIVQAVSDGRNLVQNLRASSGPSMGGGVPMSAPQEMPMMDQPASFPGMEPQDMPVQPVSYSAPLPQDPGPQGYGPQGPGPGPQGPGPQGPSPQGPQGGASPQVPMGMASVDLLVEDITLASPATKVAGPAYKIIVRNQGSEPAAKFHIGLFASLDGKVGEQNPKAFLEVRDLAPNTSGEYTIRLPKSADKMLDPISKETKPFTYLATAVDFFGVQAEADESNNTAIVPRAEIDGAKDPAELASK